MNFSFSFKFFITITILLSLCSCSKSIKENFVPNNSVQMTGTVSRISYSNSYDNSNVASDISAIFPENIKVDILFNKIRAEIEIYVNNKYQAISNNYGQAKILQYYPKPGTILIELKKENKLIATAKIDVLRSTVLRCTGNKELICLEDKE